MYKYKLKGIQDSFTEHHLVGTCSILKIKDHSDWIITCGDINDQIQKWKINVLDVFIRQLVICTLRFWIHWIDLDFLFRMDINSFV
ncbi:hypothetical protein RIR_jg14962.t1 [Rhizophagus irregularis DAOM 181602=DAOM 197198]|nr:hypothetical protein RIR_jg14962.t1 [Rhizophagus irregularis DAOM 181602=DAOM 197198]